MLLKDVLKNDGLMQHRIRVEDVADRRIWLMDLCRDRSVLHVGCCDVPIFDPDNNLHIELSNVTRRLDGLDTSPEGIEVLRNHVLGDYYTSPGQVDKDYDLVLAPEVLEHTGNAHQFLEGLFGIRAASYLVTAPNIAWHEKARREGNVFIEQVHEDHRAWYSPYTLLNSVRPFLREEEDEVRVFLIRPTGSVAVHVIRPCTIQNWSRHSSLAGQDEAHALQSLESLIREGKTAEALFELGVLRKTMDTRRLFYLHAELLLGLKRHMDLFRISGAYMRTSARDKKCLTYAAAAAEGLKRFEEAQNLRALADNL